MDLRKDPRDCENNTKYRSITCLPTTRRPAKGHDGACLYVSNNCAAHSACAGHNVKLRNVDQACQHPTLRDVSRSDSYQDWEETKILP